MSRWAVASFVASLMPLALASIAGFAGVFIGGALVAVVTAPVAILLGWLGLRDVRRRSRRGREWALAGLWIGIAEVIAGVGFLIWLFNAISNITF